ncbi:hypothetical protein K469DRAFT_729814 [Zopfia rhizophila CBS 207.26]|uniref:Rhodopsin domain-containing protein n=1 Tax=Zopfia rhizophila CBS 207.26 TaxID=1314779 RepID=A0A6A6DQB6_9PEZI|nr:hypothetical protein K469DRAFT_729814 [Zopfia rhizophila CBS 207.26]
MFIPPGQVVVIVGITLTSLSTMVVALRYYCRYFRMGVVGATDHLMLVALLLTWGNTAINYYQDIYSRRFRPSQLRFPEKRPKAEAALFGTLLTWYIYRITYVIGLCFVKLSILFFYRAIASHVTFRRAVYATITFVCLYTLAVTLAGIFQCENPSDAWSTEAFFSQFDGPGPGRPGRRPRRCNSPTKLWVFSAAVNLFSDVIILLLPIPTLLGLRVPINKRLALIGIFSVGIMAIVASCVRMWVMALWSESVSNSGRFGADLLLWGQVETNSGIISASVPFLRLLFKGKDRGLSEKERGLTPPRPRNATSNMPLELPSLAIFSGPDVGPNGSPIWKPFITVPASLSSSSRDSATLTTTHQQHPHATV